MSSHARLQHFIRPILLCLTVSALLLFLSTPYLYAAQDVVLRLDPGGHTVLVQKIAITPDGRLVTASADKKIRILVGFE